MPCLKSLVSIPSDEPRRPLCGRLIRLLCCLLLWLGLCLPEGVSAATQTAQGPAGQQTKGTAQPLRVSLILEHDDSRDAWTEQLKEGLNRAVSQLGVTGRVVLAPAGEDQQEIFRAAARESDLVLVAQERLFEILRDNAANFRRVSFGCIDTGIRAPNIMSITFDDEKAAFLAGAAAAMLSRQPTASGGAAQGTVGWLSGEETPVQRSLREAFEKGARLDAPQTRVLHAVAGSFADADAGRRAARQLLDGGAGIVVLAAGAGDVGALQELQAGRASGFGLGRSDTPLLGSITKDADRAVFELIKAAATGQFAGKKIITYALGSGTDFVLHNSSARSIPASVLQRLKELRHELQQDTIRLRKLRTPTFCDC